MIGSHLLSMFHFFGCKIWKNDFFLVVFRVFVGKKKLLFFKTKKNENATKKWKFSVYFKKVII